MKARRWLGALSRGDASDSSMIALYSLGWLENRTTRAKKIDSSLSLDNEFLQSAAACSIGGDVRSWGWLV